MKKILLSAMNGIIGYEILNHLKKKYYVIAIDSEPHGIAKQIANKFILCPKGNSKEFIKFIKKISKNVDLMFFYVDEELQNISRNLKSKHILKKIIISNSDVIDLCLNKKKFYSFLSENNVLHPRIKITSPAFVKPIYGRGSKNCSLIKDKNLLKSYMNNKSFITQEYIQGKEFTVDCYFNKANKLIFSLSRERLVKSNISISNKITKKPELNKIIKKLSKICKLYGPINFQFIIDKKTKKPFLIEINPRLSGGIIFSIYSGFDPISMAINEYFDNSYQIPSNIKYGLYTRYLISKKI